MLLSLAESGAPPDACDRMMRGLAGATADLREVAQATLQTLLGGAHWPDVRSASRGVRSLARQAGQVADAPGWSAACAPSASGRSRAA